MSSSFLRGDSVTVPNGDHRVAFVVRFIQANLAKPHLTVGEIAQELRLSPSRFRELMRQGMQMSAKSYIRELRMSRARALLRSSFLSVKEVMVMVGMSDASHFTKDYKHRFGITPSQERRLADYWTRNSTT